MVVCFGDCWSLNVCWVKNKDIGKKVYFVFDTPLNINDHFESNLEVPSIVIDKSSVIKAQILEDFVVSAST